jgi:hypothetical protein
MNKNIKMLVLTVATVASFSGAANAAQTTARGSATVLTPTAVSKVDDLQFGTIISGSVEATVTMSAAGNFICGTGLTCSGSAKPSAFNITGTGNEVVTVATDATVKLENGGNFMLAALSTSNSSITLNAGAGTFKVGGVLTVKANQPSGTYAGDFNVTVNYQ